MVDYDSLTQKDASSRAPIRKPSSKLRQPSSIAAYTESGFLSTSITYLSSLGHAKRSKTKAYLETTL
jgi:hypothetical protein